jgi:hypothetical protein
MAAPSTVKPNQAHYPYAMAVPWAESGSSMSALPGSVETKNTSPNRPPFEGSSQTRTHERLGDEGERNMWEPLHHETGCELLSKSSFIMSPFSMGIPPVGTNGAQPPGKQERTCPRLDPTGTGISKPATHKTTMIVGLAEMTIQENRH